jgi:hypothetical protein
VFSLVLKSTPVFIIIRILDKIYWESYSICQKTKDKGLGGPVGGYDTGFGRGSEEAINAVARLDSNNQIKEIDADKSPPCPAVDNGNGYCEGFHDGWK